MRRWLADLLRRVARWLEHASVELVVPQDALYADAVRLVAEWETRLGSGFGEAKRHQVLAALQKVQPGRAIQDLALAIEAAVRAS